ncbi:Helicase associated domain protein [Amylibacter sp.]|nr:Helicase associated domain protein [Amylibacter sp.]
MATFDQFISSLREEFGEQEAGKKFEIFCKWFLENDPEWSKSVDKVWLWNEYPNKWQSQDLGTDLVFHDKDGLVWAVQAKCYSKHRSTTKGDMNSFLADTGRSEVNRRLWLQTTNKIQAKAEKTCKGQDKPVTFFNLNNFRDAQLDYPTSFSELYKAKVKIKPKPEPHQIEAIKDVSSRLKTVDRGQLIMACGTGKTFTSMWIKEELKAHSTLVLLPSLSLLSQTMREWAWASNADFEILNVCSDKSVGKKTEDMKPEDAPFKVTSDVEKIVKFLKKPKPKVIFCTYQSSPLIAEAHEDSTIPSFDLIIADEAHRCAGKAKAGFATVLDGNKIRSSKRLFTTATPRYFGKAIKDAAKAKDLAVVGMDDEKVFGSVLHKLTFGKAIQDGHLTDYQVVIIGVDEPMIKQYIDEQEIIAINSDETTDARTLAAKIGLLKAIKDYDLKRVISFHSRVSGARMFSEELINVVNIIDPKHRPEGTFLTNYVSGTMKAGDRKDKIDKLKALESHDRGILTNARCLAEGVDVPALDGVAFIDPKGSQVEIIQAVGRAIRKVRGAKAQTKGTIVIPVFIEDGDDPETSIEASNFKPVWDVLKALKAHDEILADELDQYRTNMAKNTPGNYGGIGDKVIFDISTTVIPGFSSALQTVLVEASTSSWVYWIGLLEKFKEREGHCNVNQTHRESNLNLGRWTRSQREKKHCLTPLQVERLDALGFEWDPITSQWNMMFEKLNDYYQKYNSSLVPLRFDKSKPNSLGVWVIGQRDRYRAKKMSDAQIKQFKIFHDWRWSFDDWDEIFNCVQKLCADRKCDISEISQKDIATSGQKLKNWLNAQRSKGKEKLLDTDRIIKLESLPGWFWNEFDQWMRNYNHVVEFAKINNHTRLPRGKLNSWIKLQRTKKEILTEQQINLLQQIEHWSWDPIKDAWERGILELINYKKNNKHLYVPQRYTSDTGHKLGIWINKCRVEYKSGKLQKERIQELELFPDWVWDPLTHKWEEIYSKALDIRMANNNFQNIEIIPGVFYGKWIKLQKVNSDKLSKKRQRLMVKLYK